MSKARKTVKKALSLFLSIAMSVTFIMYLFPDTSMSVYAANGWEEKNGVLTIGSQSAMSSWANSKAPSNTLQKIWCIKIGEGVDSIPEAAFMNMSNLRQVHFPSTLEVIYKNAFYNCQKYISVTLPEGVEEINDYAFADKTQIEKVICLPSTIDFLSMNSFGNNKKLTVFGCTNNVKTITEIAGGTYVPYDVDFSSGGNSGRNIFSYNNFSNWSAVSDYGNNGKEGVFIKDGGSTLRLSTGREPSYIVAQPRQYFINPEGLSDNYFANIVKITVNANSSSSEALRKVYAGFQKNNYYSPLIDMDVEDEYSNGTTSYAVLSAYVVLPNAASTIKLQLGLGKDFNKVAGSVNITNVSVDYAKNGKTASFSVGDSSDPMGITFLTSTSIRDYYNGQAMDMTSACDKADVLLTMAMYYKFRQSLQNVTAVPNEQRLYILNSGHQDMYSCRLSGIPFISIGGLMTGYAFDMKRHALGCYGITHEIAHCSRSYQYDSAFFHTGDDCDANFRATVALSGSKYLQNVPIVRDDRVIFKDRTYDFSGNTYTISRNGCKFTFNNAMEAANLAYNTDGGKINYLKDDIGVGYLCDATYVAYKLMYDDFGSYAQKAFSNMYKGIYSSDFNNGTDSNTVIDNALETALTPGFGISNSDICENSKRYLNQVNCLLSKYYMLRGNPQENAFGKFNQSNPKTMDAIRRAFYTVEQNVTFDDSRTNKWTGYISKTASKQYSAVSRICLTNHISGAAPLSGISELICADMNFDGYIDNNDLTIYTNYLLQDDDYYYSPADFIR